MRTNAFQRFLPVNHTRVPPKLASGSRISPFLLSHCWARCWEGEGERKFPPALSWLHVTYPSHTAQMPSVFARLCLKKSFTQGQCSLTQGKGRVQNSHGSRYKLIQEMKRQRWLAPAGPSSVLISQHADKAMGWGVVPADEQICWFMYHCLLFPVCWVGDGGKKGFPVPESSTISYGKVLNGGTVCVLWRSSHFTNVMCW